MPKFSYLALDSRGAEKSGQLDASDVRQVAVLLRSQGLFPTDIGLTQSSKVAKKAPSSVLRPLSSVLWFRPVSAKELAVFTRQLGTLLRAGMPLLRGLEVRAARKRIPVSAR